MQEEGLKELLAGVRRSDKNAFDEVFNRCYDPLVNFSMRFVNITEDAEDIVSSFFVTLWHNSEKIPDLESPKFYLYRSVKNASLNHLKHKKLKINDHARSTLSDNNTQLQTENKELNLVIEEAINKLPEQRRIIFQLIKGEGMRSKEVAETLGLSIRTVENQLYRAVDTIATSLRDYLGYNPKSKTITNFLLMLY